MIKSVFISAGKSFDSLPAAREGIFEIRRNVMPGQFVENKPLLKSKTLWFNLLTLIVATAVFLLDQQLIIDNPQIAYWLGIFITIGNTVLRLVTSQPVELRL